MKLSSLIMAATLALVAPSLGAEAVSGEQTYDLLFREGTLDLVARDQSIVYSRAVTNTLKPDAAKRDTGDVALFFGQDSAALALLEFRQDEKYRRLGKFPASVGNPMIMYFYETTIRDMAEAAGGSPFYIRNRVKDALIQPSDVHAGQAIVDGAQVQTRIIRLHPFADDPNSDRMKGFGDLELTVTMSDDVPGWYLSLVAQAGAIYRSELVFKTLEPRP